MNRTSQFTKTIICASAFLLLCGLILSVPSKAGAIQVTKSVDSTMTIKMQESQDDDQIDDDSTDDDATTDNTSTNHSKNPTVKAVTPVSSSEKGGGLPLTGDVLLLAILGMIALFAGSAFCLVESKKLNAVQGAHVRKTTRGVHMRPQNLEDVKKRVMGATIATVLLAGTCFGGLTSKTNALAEGVDASVKCTSAVEIDEAGNVVSAKVTVQNNTLKAIDVSSVVAPTELSDWTATFETTSVAVSGRATGTWDGKTVPSDILQQVKENGSVTLTFQTTFSTEPDELDFSVFSLEEENWVYDKTSKTPEIVCAGMYVMETDYTVTYGENVNAGEGAVTITGKGEYTGSKDFKFTIDKAKLSVAGIKVDNKTYDATTDATFNYDDMSITGKVGADEVSVIATDSFPSADVGIQTVPLTLTLAGTDADNYEIDTDVSQTSAQGEITKALVTVTGITASGKTYDGDTNATLGYGSATLTGCIDADKSKLSVTATGTFDGKDVGTDKTVTISNLALSGDAAVLANYELASTGQQTSTTANITAREVTVTWNPSEEASYLYDGSTRTPTATIGSVVDGESLSATLTYKDSSGTTLSSAPSAIGTYTATVAGLTDATGTTASNYELPATELSKSFSIVERSGYWLAATGADDPAAVVYKGQSQIDEDMAVLHGTKAQTSAGKDKTAVTTEYTNYMNGTTKTTDGKEIRLYTKWYGSTQDESSIYGQPTNQWVEFRFIQVGEHDGDGSAVTFMATHSLPAAKAMNSSGSNAGGWYASDMRGCMTSYVEAGLPDLASAVKAVNKRTIYRSSESGPWSTTSANSITSDRFWLLSIKELTGSEQDEGSQYAWCKNNSITHDAYNRAIADMNTSRAGNRPYRAHLLCWWVRSPNTINPYFDYRYFGCVYSGGRPDIDGSSTTNMYGVVPCFAF